MSGGGGYSLPRGNLLNAIPEMIGDFQKGYLSQSIIALKAGIDVRTLRTALRKGEKATAGPLRDLYLAELASRPKRPWGCNSGSGKPFPKPSARTLAERAAEAKMWAELWAPRSDASSENIVSDEDDTDTSSISGDTSKRSWDMERDLADLLGFHEEYEARARNNPKENQTDEPVSKSPKNLDTQPPIKRGRGRPRGLTPQLIESISITIRYGSSRADTAVGLGLHPRTLPKWLARGKSETAGLYSELYQLVGEARRRRCQPSPLVEVIHSTEAAGRESLDLTLPTIEALRKRTGVRFLWGVRVDDKPHLIELRWPKPRRKLTIEQQQYLLTRGLQVMARAADRSFRSIVFVAAPPRVRATPLSGKG
jgi:hypothetical protein